MNLKDLILDTRLQFNPERHEYILDNVLKMASLTKTISRIKQPFDSKEMSYNVARSKLGWKSATEENIKIEQEKVLKKWKDKSEFAASWGTMIHNALKDYFTKGYFNIEDNEISSKIQRLCKRLSLDMQESMYYFSGNEIMIYSEKYGIAGTVDRICQRQRIDTSLIDIFDYKTNITNISFDSIKKMEDNNTAKPYKHYNRMLLDPLSHLEQCDYIYDALQLSGYAYMIEEMGMKPGRLSIIQIDEIDMNPTIYPVPYMKMEIELLFKAFSNRELSSVNETNAHIVEW